MIDLSTLRISGRRLAAILACGGWLMAIAPSAWARPLLNDTQHFLLAQQITDGLPPPPAFGQAAMSQAQQYLVVVNGDSQILLSQVQAVQPTASVQEYSGQRFIQAGLYSDATSAQQQVDALANAGIGAQVVAVTSPGAQAVSQADPNSSAFPPAEPLPTTVMPSGQSGPSSVEFNAAPPAPGSSADSNGRSYYVVIPSNGKKLDTLSEQVTRLTSGMGVDGMIATDTRRGAHVQVGPFNSRDAANRWTSYFRDFGMDARVTYGS